MLVDVVGYPFLGGSYFCGPSHICANSGEETILKDLIECQGSAVDIGGYYRVDKAKADRAMNPSQSPGWKF